MFKKPFKIEEYLGEHQEQGAVITDATGERVIVTDPIHGSPGDKATWSEYMARNTFILDQLNGSTVQITGGDTRYKTFRNFMVNELGVTRADIEEWTRGAVLGEMGGAPYSLLRSRSIRRIYEKIRKPGNP